MSELDWPILHAYRKLADEGKVKQLRCPDCQSLYVPTINAETKPILMCFFCGISLRPGLELAAQIIAVVKEHHG